MDSLTSTVGSLRHAALTQLQLWQFFSFAWSIKGDVTDPHRRDPAACLEFLGQICFTATSFDGYYQALDHYALASHGQQHNCHAHGRSATEFVLNLSLWLVKMFRDQFHVELLKFDDAGDQFKERIRLIWDNCITQIRNMPCLTKQECDMLKAEIDWEYTRALDRAKGIDDSEQASSNKGKPVRKERRSAPETVRRNIEICDRRNQDREKWTFGRLAKEYKIKRQTVLAILKEEDKWWHP